MISEMTTIGYSWS